MAADKANNLSFNQPVAQYVLYCAARKRLVDLKVRCVVSGVQPVIGTGMVIASTALVGVDRGDSDDVLEFK